MDDYNQINKNNFLYQPHQYLGKFTPQNLVFNANLQEFSQRVSYICNQQTDEKYSPLTCYEEIDRLWQQLTHSFKTLGIDKNETE
ncbi:DUF7219 family protein [Nostoc sp. CALU 546]|uniref:DUF7219 family protein n=1 Tax=Nostoc sp. CALU 546 TaxID=1867241 RepID=UPI003B67E1D3